MDAEALDEPSLLLPRAGGVSPPTTPRAAARAQSHAGLGPAAPRFDGDAAEARELRGVEGLVGLHEALREEGPGARERRGRRAGRVLERLLRARDR